MKTLMKFSAVPLLTGLFFFSAAGAQERKAAEPKPVPMAAPAIKTPTQENPQKQEEPKAAPATSAPAAEKKAKRKAEAAPAEKPEIAVSDPGVPNEKSSAGKKTAAPQPTLAPAKKEKTETNPQ